jgi:signal transduction histidine kinase/CheY-like chemotaxis protein
MSIQSKDLLEQLADLQLSLEGFSFDQLTAREATALKASFEQFRNHLETQLWKPSPGKGPLPVQQEQNPQESNSLIAAVSHDIRTPLNGIIGFSDLLREDTLSPKQREYAEAIGAASRSMLGMVNELLLYTRLRAGKEAVVEVPFRVRQILEEAGDFVKRSLHSGEVDFKTTISPQVPEVLVGDPSKLSQVLLNLLGNAVKYVSRGEISLEVQALRNPDACTLSFEIRDTGIGIPADELPHIFKPYYQARQAPEVAGTGHGLGLSIVRKLIEQQGGRIGVQSTVGEGTVFRFELPFKTGRSRELPKTPPGKPSRRGLLGARVLVFEDNPLNQKLLETRLKGWGCKVFHAPRVPFGIRLLADQPIDLILMDLRMPEMDGFEAAKRVRRHASPVVRNLPIIAVTADFTAEDSERFKQAGINDLILKPYNPEELYSKMAGFFLKGREVARGDEPLEVHKAGAGELLSLDDLERECMGNQDLLADLVSLLRNNLLEFAGRMKIHLQQKDLESIMDAAHKIKPGLKMIRATSMHSLVEAMYQFSLQGRDLQQIRRAYQDFLTLYPHVEQALERELNRRK